MWKASVLMLVVFGATISGWAETRVPGDKSNNLIFLPPPVRGVKFKGEVNTTFDLGFAKKHPEISDDLMEIARTVEYSGVGDSVAIDLTCNSKSGKTHIGSYKGATDGSGMQTLDRRTGVLILTTKSDFLPFFFGMDPLSRPYAYLLDNGNLTKSPPLSLADISAKIKSLKIAIDPLAHASKDFANVIIKGADGSNFSVTLDVNKSFYPVGYDCFDANSILRARYRIQNLGSIELSGNEYFLYPKKASIELFDDRGNRIRTDELTITSLDLVDADSEMDANTFKINPELAKTIWDKENNVFVPTGASAVSDR